MNTYIAIVVFHFKLSCSNFFPSSAHSEEEVFPSSAHSEEEGCFHARDVREQLAKVAVYLLSPPTYYSCMNAFYLLLLFI
jgi:hypothetical protein